MAIKKTETKTTKKPASRATKATAPIAVVAKTTKPKVVVQTKTVREPLPTFVREEGCCKGNKPCCAKKCLWKVLIVLVLLASLTFSILAYKAVKEQQNFTIMSNGGVENYEMLKSIYSTPEFETASTLSVYQLIDRVNQTLADQNANYDAGQNPDQYVDQYGEEYAQ